MRNKRSLKLEIRYLIYNSFPEYVNGGRVERLAMELGYKASNGSRRARELENENILEKRYNRGSVEYRYNPGLISKVENQKN